MKILMALILTVSLTTSTLLPGESNVETYEPVYLELPDQKSDEAPKKCDAKKHEDVIENSLFTIGLNLLAK